MFELPWGERSVDDYDIDRARAVLDADHTGLDEVKERIVEMLAVRKLLAERAAEDAAAEAAEQTESGDADGRRPTATSRATTAPTRSTRRPSRSWPSSRPATTGASPAPSWRWPALPASARRRSAPRSPAPSGRKFTRVALGGIRDEAEIRGHRRTYVGAQAGRIVRALQEAGTMNPVILLDEVDKVGADWRGDPSSALLEVLDPAQNHTFRDHYLEVDLDLSDVLFLATANVLETIPGPLLDRMEVIRLDGYTEDEKVAIARDHLFDRQRSATACARARSR